MFRFLELSLHGWDLWPAVRIPLHRDVVLVTGPNGAGKTTLLDAIRQLLNAPRLSSKRRLQHYLRHADRPALLRAVVSNEGGERGPPFARERILTPEATLACALVPGSGGTPEKRFVVLPGRPSVAELQARLLESRDWYGADRYARVLESAGVTRSLMGVLAIEQGRTNSLFELKPRELFLRVLEMLGDRAVLERYRDARGRYDDTRRELLHQITALAGRQAELETAKREVRRLEEYEQARQKVAVLEATLPAAELQIDLKRKLAIEPKLQELRTKVARGETDRARLEAEASASEASEKEADAWVADLRGRERDLQERHNDAIAAEAGTRVEVTRLEALQAELADLPEGDPVATDAHCETARRTVFECEVALHIAEDDASVLGAKIAELEAGRPSYPEAVVRTLDDLRGRGIPGEVLAAQCEVSGDDLGAAVEAALGDARYALVVPEDAAAAAIDVAVRHAFPGPIWSGPRLGIEAQVGPLAVAGGAPSWVPSWLETIELEARGRWRDGRGTWVAGPEGRVLGHKGREAELARCRDRARDLNRQADDLRASLEAAGARLDELRALQEKLRRRSEVLRELVKLPRARLELESKAGALALARGEYGTARGLLETAAEKHRVASIARTKSRDGLENFIKQHEGEKRSVDEQSKELAAIDAHLAEAVSRIPHELIGRAHRGELDGPDTVRQDLTNARAHLARLGEPPPETAREEARHLQANVEELEHHVKSRQGEVDAAEKELALCRERYLEIVSGALRDYRSRVQSVAAMADLSVEMQLPSLGADDRSFDEARIDVSIGFDGKEVLPLGDASFSGGQQVIAGLVLLMGMAEVEGRGFFMLDEPFAHLSLDRVDQVGRFLRATKSQFILTAPTTLDRAQLDPASLVVVLRKMRPGEDAAPVPIVAEA